MTMNKSLLSLLLVSVQIFAAPKCNEVFSTEQIHVLQRSYDFGKTYGYGYTLAAVAWRESSAGVNLVRFEPPYRYDNASYGVFHNYLKTVMKRDKCSNVSCGAKITQRLINDFEYSAQKAIEELLYWEGVKGKGNLKEIWRGYNDGYRGSEKGFRYADDIASKILYFKQCIRFN